MRFPGESQRAKARLSWAVLGMSFALGSCGEGQQQWRAPGWDAPLRIEGPRSLRATVGREVQVGLGARGGCGGGEVGSRVLRGELPPGLELQHAGFKGTPTREGVFELDVELIDAACLPPRTAVAHVTWTVEPATSAK